MNKWTRWKNDDPLLLMLNASTREIEYALATELAAVDEAFAEEELEPLAVGVGARIASSTGARSSRAEVAMP